MLFELDASLQARIDKGLNEDGQHVLESLASSAIRGDHVLIGDRKVLLSLASCSVLSTMARKLYLRLSTEATTSGGLATLVGRRIRIVDDGCTPAESAGEIVLTLPEATRLIPFSAPVLLVEGPYDAEYFVHIASEYVKGRGIQGLSIRLNSELGGGDTTADRFEEIRSSGQRLCLCIVDSDKAWPLGPLGTTARKLHKRRGVSGFSEVYILSVRAIENLFPVRSLATYLKTMEGIKEIVKLLNELGSLANGDSVLAHINMKTGLSVWELKYLQTRPDAKHLVESALMHEAVRREFEASTRCHLCSKKADCNCVLVRGIGERALATVTKQLRKGTALPAASLTRKQSDEWEAIGEKVFAWGCASMPKAST